MTDAFATLGLVRRPWIEPGEIVQRHRNLAVGAHPDRAGGDGGRLALLNEARSILESHALRLRHLVALESGAVETPQVTPDWELAAKAGDVARRVEAWAAQRDRADSALQRALVTAAVPGLRQAWDAAQADVVRKQQRIEEEIRAVDAQWPDVSLPGLLALASAWTFASRAGDTLHEAAARLDGA